ncbi:glycosyltransferase family 4 protein [Glycomyces harbinensis]|uniref:Glycosyltransferase involved in cell wall bisynthesis n=1 Tax=Glycomyces harbinensis TaxID=58114 RepID=A0A1G6UZ38_9ACTN|nr:glycosyltransferase family 4 protein [Glycomyces harbinensis]SDD45895.1 Glycosyltransferase involved in cell wall bisynthesis [Glycomyces harbinensis]
MTDQERPKQDRRVVMLVQNDVEGDSRVQKEAASAAAAGFEVFLLGRSPDSHQREWDLGGATVRLLPVTRGFARRPHELRPAWLRDPLAYPYGPLQPYRERQLRVRSAQLRLDGMQYGLDEPGLAPAARLRRRAGLRVRGALLRANENWVRLRAEHTVRLRLRRRQMISRLDRFTTWLSGLLPGGPGWRRFDPALWDLELAFGRAVHDLEPDLIHANDFQMLGVGARAKLRAAAEGREVRLVWDAHEYLPGMKPWNAHPRWHPAQLAHEREFAASADAVVTVSAALGDLLQDRHRLAEPPAVVMNAPGAAAADGAAPAPSLRAACGIGPDVPLMVYSGAAAPQRGLDLMVTALRSLPDVHSAFVVANPEAPYIRQLLERAGRLGVAERVHAVPYVPHTQVVPFLSEADVGVIPLRRYLNHEIALITKFFEYSHARLPVVVSDVKAMAETVAATGQGEVFAADDAEGLAQAVKSVITAPEAYRSAYTADRLAEWSWEAQAARLNGLYRRLLDEVPAVPSARTGRAGASGRNAPHYQDLHRPRIHKALEEDDPSYSLTWFPMLRRTCYDAVT